MVGSGIFVVMSDYTDGSWRCAGCGMTVYPGWTHNCAGMGVYFTPTSDEVRIVAALERIAAALEKRGR